MSVLLSIAVDIDREYLKNRFGGINGTEVVRQMTAKLRKHRSKWGAGKSRNRIKTEWYLKRHSSLMQSDAQRPPHCLKQSAVPVLTSCWPLACFTLVSKPCLSAEAWADKETQSTNESLQSKLRHVLHIILSRGSCEDENTQLLSMHGPCGMMAELSGLRAMWRVNRSALHKYYLRKPAVSGRDCGQRGGLVASRAAARHGRKP